MADQAHTEIGYKLSSEEFGPLDLVRNARSAEESGFTFALISDHYHPWTDRQGQSPLVWAVLGALAQATQRMRIGTGVTCPTIRIHPAIIAQAAATVATMMPGRFFLGVGSGENLNEHILGDRWPPVDVRHEMLEEAIEVIRLLWQGGYQDYRSIYYTVENARIYTLPEQPPPIYVAASGPKAAELAGRMGDGLITTDANPKLATTFAEAGGEARPRMVELSVCWAESEAKARRTALEVWPIAGFAGPLVVELALPAHFQAVATMVTEERIAQAVICGPDVERHVEAIRKCADAGFDHVCVHQIGPDQEGFLRFYKREVLPQVAAVRTRKRAA